MEKTAFAAVPNVENQMLYMLPPKLLMCVSMCI